MWTSPLPDSVDGPMIGADRPLLEGYLRWERSTLLAICAGLSADQLALRPLASSNLSLLGLMRHLAKVERIWFRRRAGDQAIPPLFDPALGKDHDFDEVHAADAEGAVEQLQEEWRQADAAAAELAFEHAVLVHGEEMSLRMIYVHMIGEYARHNGHADLLRESIDGVTGR